MATALLVIGIVTLVGIAALGIWDGIATITGFETISKRVQIFIEVHPIASVLVFAALGFIISLSIHFEVSSLHFWILIALGIAGGSLIGIGVALLRSHKSSLRLRAK